jgi:hypothetical protein
LTKRLSPCRRSCDGWFHNIMTWRHWFKWICGSMVLSWHSVCTLFCSVPQVFCYNVLLISRVWMVLSPGLTLCAC